MQEQDKNKTQTLNKKAGRMREEGAGGEEGTKAEVLKLPD